MRIKGGDQKEKLDDLEACKEKCVSPDLIQKNHVPSEAQCLSNRVIQKRALLVASGILCIGLFCTGYGFLKGEVTVAWAGAAICIAAMYLMVFLLG